MPRDLTPETPRHSVFAQVAKAELFRNQAEDMERHAYSGPQSENAFQIATGMTIGDCVASGVMEFPEHGVDFFFKRIE